MKKLSENQVIWWERQRRGGRLRFLAKKVLSVVIVAIFSLVCVKFVFGEEIRLHNVIILSVIFSVFGLAKGWLEWDIFDTRYEAMFNRTKSF